MQRLQRVPFQQLALLLVLSLLLGRPQPGLVAATGHSPPAATVIPATPTLRLLWPAAVYTADLSPEMSAAITTTTTTTSTDTPELSETTLEAATETTPEAMTTTTRTTTLNAQLAEVVADGFRQSQRQQPPRLRPDQANNHFYLWQNGIGGQGLDDDHFVKAARIAAERCYTDPKRNRSAAECAKAAALAGGWPALHNSEGYRRLFAWDNGLVWQHARRFARAMGLSEPVGLGDSDDRDGAGAYEGIGSRRRALFADKHRPPAYHFWANYHYNTTVHVEHDHMGSVISGIYYVDVDPASASHLRMKDPRRPGLFRQLSRRQGSRRESRRDHRRRRNQRGRRRRRQELYGHHHDVVPRSGLLVLYPSWIPHEVAPMPPAARDGSSGGPRISFAFNINAQGTLAIEPEGVVDLTDMAGSDDTDDGYWEVGPDGDGEASAPRAGAGTLLHGFRMESQGVAAWAWNTGCNPDASPRYPD